MIDVSSLNSFITLTKFKMGTNVISSGLRQARGHNVLYPHEGCIPPSSNSSGFLSIPSDLLEQEGLPVQGMVLVLPQNPRSLLEYSLWCLIWLAGERDLTAPLFGQLGKS